MDPFQQQPSPVDGFASTLTSTNQEVTRITPTPASDGAPAKGAIIVDISYSPLSDASEEAVRLSQLDDLAMSYNVCINLMRRTIPSFSFKGSIILL